MTPIQAAYVLTRLRQCGATISDAGRHAISVSAPAHVHVPEELRQLAAWHGSVLAQALHAEQRAATPEAVPVPQSRASAPRRRYFTR